MNRIIPTLLKSLLVLALAGVCVLVVTGRDSAIIAQGGTVRSIGGSKVKKADFTVSENSSPIPENTPVPTPEPAPTPTPEPYENGFDFNGKHYEKNISELNLTGSSDGQLEELLQVLPWLPSLRTIVLGDERANPIAWSLIRKIADAAPTAELDYAFSLYGYNEYNLKDPEIDLRKIEVDDDAVHVEEVLSCMKNCTYLDMDSCGVESERMVEIRDAFPNVKVVWRVRFGVGVTYSLRTDATTCMASLSGGGWGEGPRDPEDVWGLQYCTDLKYLDLGHNNNLRTCFFLEYMPDLEVAIFCTTHLTDISPIANCKKLRYLELYWNPVSDITPLAGLDNMTDLLISYLPNVTDMSCLVPAEVMPKLTRLWIGDITDVPHSQIEEFQKNHPNCLVNDTDNAIMNEWRYSEINNPEYTGIPNVLWPQYQEIRDIFGYDYNPVCYSKAEYDPYWYTPHGQEVPDRYHNFNY